MINETLMAVANELPYLTDIEPDAGIIGEEGEESVTALIALVFWVVSALLVVWFAVAIAGFGRARSNNPAAMDGAKKNLAVSLGALVLWGGFSLIVSIATGILG